MKTARPVVALAATSILLLTGCRSEPDSQPEAESATEVSASSSPSATPSDEPRESPALMERAKKKNGTYEKGTRDTIGGIVSWEIQPGPKLPRALAVRLGRKADSFLAEHVMREDRWLGSHQIKAGELDDLATVMTPRLYGAVEGAAVWLDDLNEKYDAKWNDVPKTVQKQAQPRAQALGHFILNTDVVKGGNGEGRHEITRKVVWVPTDGDNKGTPVTWVYVKTRHLNNTGQGREFAIWQAWREVAGEWLIYDSGWSAR